MSEMLIVLLIVTLVAMWWVYTTFSQAFALRAFLLEVYASILSFEWKPSEEIGKRINASKNEKIRHYVDTYHNTSSIHEDRESRCKLLAIHVTPLLVKRGMAEVHCEAATKEWCDENAPLLRELSQEEIDGYIKKSKGIEANLSLDHVLPDEIRKELLELDKTIARIGLYDIVLVKKKPGGRRPPKWSLKTKMAHGDMQGIRA